jgi:predicted transposase YdaD
MERGREEGRQEGQQEGLHQGTVVGRIQHTQELLGLPVADAAELASKDPAVLRALASELDACLKDQLARLRSRPSEN